MRALHVSTDVIGYWRANPVLKHRDYSVHTEYIFFSNPLHFPVVFTASQTWSDSYI